jgi:hypothetical protein
VAPAFELVARVRSAPRVNPACLRTAVTGFLAGRGIPVQWPTAETPPPERPSTRRLSLEIDLTDPARAALTFTDATGGSPQRRELALEHGLDSIGCESLADVIEASVLAMTATAPAVSPSPTSVPAPDSAAPTPATMPTIRADAAVGGDRPALALAYTLEPAATDIVQSGVELGFGSRPGHLRRRDWLRVAYTFPATANVDGASARWQSLSAAAATSISSRGRRAWFELGTGIGFNVTFVETRSLDAGGSIASDHKTQVAPTFGSDVSIAVRVAPRAVLYASLRLPVISSQPVTLQSNGMTVFESWWFFRPALVIGGRWQ